jgi:GNAT superfamily N-acetyltransferase
MMSARPGHSIAPGRPARRLSVADLDACVRLATDRDWPVERSKWRLLFAVGEVYGIRGEDGDLAAMAVLTRYGHQLAAVGMMVVAQRYGRQGLGRRLLTEVLQLAAGAVVHLTATSYGEPLYQRLGFRAVDTMDTHAGHFRAAPPVPPGAPRPAAAAAPAPAAVPVPVSPADLDQLAALDLRVFGADRRHVLTELLTFADSFVVRREAGQVAGFAAAWQNADQLVIGPVVATSRAVATSLISSIALARDGLVRIDIRGGHRWLADWAAQRGLAPSGGTTLMVLDGDLPGQRDLLYAPVSVAIG